MWRSVKGEVEYLIKHDICAANIKLVITNLKHVWQTCLNENELLEIIQDQNQLIEIDGKFVNETLWNVIDAFLESRQIDNSSDCSLHINVLDDQTLQFKFSSKMDYLSFKMKLTLALQSSNILFEEVTGPLLSVANVLLARQEHLFLLLEQKDREIGQYKLEGASLLRRNVQTTPFNRQEFLSGYPDCGSKVSAKVDVADIINLMCEVNTKSDSSILDQLAGNSTVTQALCDDVSIKAEVDTNDQIQTLRVPKKKRTKLNI